MNPTLPNSGVQQTYASPPPTSVPKKNYKLQIFIFIIIFLGISIIGGALYYKNKTFSSKALPPEAPRTNITGLEIAKRTADFLQTTIKPDGSFYYEYNCPTKDAPCTLKRDDGPGTNGYQILFFLNLSEQLNDPSYKVKADKAAQYWLVKCETLGGPWCQQHNRAMITYFQKTNDQRYKNYILKGSTDLLRDQSVIEAVNNNTGRNLEILYSLTGDKKYLDKLVQIANQAKNGSLNNDKENPVIFSEEGTTIRKLTFLSAWSLFLPAYRASHDETYLNEVKQVYDNVSLIKHLDDIKPLRDNTITLILDTLLDLDKETNQPNNPYLNLATNIAQQIYYFLGDTPENRIFSGDNGFLTVFGKAPNSKVTSYNALLGMSYLRLSDKTFEFKVKKQ